MATRRIGIINWTTLPIVTGGAYFAPYTNLNAGSALDRDVLVLLASAVNGINGSFEIPEDYVGTPKCKVVWTSETTAGDLDLDFIHRVIAGTDSLLLDTTTSPSQRTDSQDNNAGPSTASNRMVDEIVLTATDFAAGATCHFELMRDGVSDGKAASVSIWAAEFTYVDA